MPNAASGTGSGTDRWTRRPASAEEERILRERRHVERHAGEVDAEVAAGTGSVAPADAERASTAAAVRDGLPQRGNSSSPPASAASSMPRFEDTFGSSAPCVT